MFTKQLIAETICFPILTENFLLQTYEAKNTTILLVEFFLLNPDITSWTEHQH